MVGGQIAMIYSPLNDYELINLKTGETILRSTFTECYKHPEYNDPMKIVLSHEAAEDYRKESFEYENS
jgi:hypothetical protein